mmetsp:Transcript_3072/g.5353  ORF Transcript_3072/g.5353 Transcript_3072/m.5353 type:complete len:103 (-) Transcript_3072:796-1104(-)
MGEAAVIKDGNISLVPGGLSGCNPGALPVVRHTGKQLYTGTSSKKFSQRHQLHSTNELPYLPLGTSYTGTTLKGTRTTSYRSLWWGQMEVRYSWKWGLQSHP